MIFLFVVGRRSTAFTGGHATQIYAILTINTFSFQLNIVQGIILWSKEFRVLSDA